MTWPEAIVWAVAILAGAPVALALVVLLLAGAALAWAVVSDKLEARKGARRK
jgi:hypothetical protein